MKQMREFWHLEFWQGYVTAAAAWLVSFMSPLWPFLIFTVCLVVADFYTGVRAAMKRGDKITSRGFFRLVEKILMYYIAILASEGMHHVFGLPSQLSYVTAFAIALTEFKSNIENIETVTGVSVLTTINKFLNINTLKK